MSERPPQPLSDLQAVLGAAESTLKWIVTEVATARARAAPLLPSEDFIDDASEAPGIEGWALSLDGSAQQLITTLSETVLVGLDRARRSSPEEPSPEPRPWVGEQILTAAQLLSSDSESGRVATEPGGAEEKAAG